MDWGWGVTFLLVNDIVCICVDCDNDGIGEEVAGADQVHGIWILHGDLLADLHHPEDDDQVGSTSSQCCSYSNALVC